jgi:hypothetical protein
MGKLFKNKKKLTKIIVLITAIAVCVLLAVNENAASVIGSILGVTSNTQEKEPKPAASGKTNTKNKSNNVLDSMFGSVESDYSTTNRNETNYSTTNKSSLPTLTNEYSTTNRDNFWTEYRGGYKDGDEAAAAEIKERERIYGGRH